ncbi:uncharacterized protein LOC134816379 isoform X1 [Bolinopsis microptera]|uniref:uncharacterized protein LOC134816379 isoform X1 n=1 Tax=Bolinopsis microptera TaxID=2820187 RepID=UPI003078C230
MTETLCSRFITSLKRCLPRLSPPRGKDLAFHNVLVNAFAVMLIYSAHFGSCAIAPIVIESMKGVGGIDTHLLFSGMAVSSVATVLSTSFISPAIDKLGTRFCLILGGIFIITLPSSLFYPIPAVFLTFQAVNGVGCAILRAASLKFLTDNTPYDKLAEYNGLHWSIFMSCILVGNTLLFIATGSNDTIDNDLRFRICICLTTIGTIGVILYITALRSATKPALKTLSF